MHCKQTEENFAGFTSICDSWKMNLNEGQKSENRMTVMVLIYFILNDLWSQTIISLIKVSHFFLFFVCLLVGCFLFFFLFSCPIEIRKVLSKLSKEKDCEALAEWIKLCENHFYWVNRDWSCNTRKTRDDHQINICLLFVHLFVPSLINIALF